MAANKTSSKKKATAKKAPAKKRASTASKAKPKKPAAKKAQTAAPQPGTTIRRDYKGKTYELKATADGFVLGDVHFRTLTAAAKAVTGYAAVSGPRFWLGTVEQGGSK